MKLRSVTKQQFALSLEASVLVCQSLTTIANELTPKRLAPRQLFELLYLLRSLEHFESIILLLERERYNSALALRRVLYETYLRGLWISQCAPDGVIIAAYGNRFRFANERELLKRKRLESELETAKVRGLHLESKFYKLGCGFVHGGLQETAYPTQSNSRVSAYLFSLLHRELRLSTLRLLHIFLVFHANLLQAALKAKPHGSSGVDEIMARTDQIKALIEPYEGRLSRLYTRPSSPPTAEGSSV